MAQILDRREGVAEVCCAFCSGSGLDPFEILSRLSACPVCGGRLRISVREPVFSCAFCRGTGNHPHTRLTCSSCLGRGVFTMREPLGKCPDCSGRGNRPPSSLPCASCSGRGVFSKEMEESS